MDWSIGNLLWIVIGGAIVGIIARLLLPGRQSIPFWAVVVAGIVGMLVGDWLAGLIGVEETAGFDWIRHGLQLLVGVGAVAAVAAATETRSVFADDNPVAAGFLCLIERLIGSMGQLVRCLAMIRIGSDARRGSKRKLEISEGDPNRLDLQTPALGALGCNTQRHARHQDDEFLATPARGKIAAPAGLGQQRRNGL